MQLLTSVAVPGASGKSCEGSCTQVEESWLLDKNWKKNVSAWICERMNGPVKRSRIRRRAVGCAP